MASGNVAFTQAVLPVPRGPKRKKLWRAGWLSKRAYITRFCTTKTNYYSIFVDAMPHRHSYPTWAPNSLSVTLIQVRIISFLVAWTFRGPGRPFPGGSARAAASGARASPPSRLALDPVTARAAAKARRQRET